MTQNIFQIYSATNKLPFAASRQNWRNTDMIVVTRIEPKGNYGKAFGFSVRDGVPTDHVAYSTWKKDMALPNVGSYQWRLIDIPEASLAELVVQFYRGVGKRFGFTPPTENIELAEEFIDGLPEEHEEI
jgi:hypothetical protein